MGEVSPLPVGANSQIGQLQTAFHSKETERVVSGPVVEKGRAVLRGAEQEEASLSTQLLKETVKNGKRLGRRREH